MTAEISGENLLRSRHSVRRFRAQPVPQTILESLLVTACQAPSAHNRQPWRFAVITNSGIRSNLASQMGSVFYSVMQSDGIPADEIAARLQKSKIRLESAPCAIVLCVDYSDMDVYSDPDRRGMEQLMAEQSVAMAGGTLLLAAHAEGLGGVWLCAPLFASAVAKRELNLPETWEPRALLLLGYPDENPPARLRKPLAEVARFYP